MLGVPRRQPDVRQPSTRQIEETRREARMVELENMVRRLEAELDGVGTSINSVAQKADASAALISRIASRYPVRDLFVEEPPIEQIIAQLYGKMEGADVLHAEPAGRTEART